ncbi:MAG: hypothetical protein ACK4ND_03265 [Cytophagaceae bacterium]
MKHLLLAAILLFISSFSFGQDPVSESEKIDSSSVYRDYHILIAPDYDIYNASTNLRTGGKLLHDAFNRGIGPKIKNKTIRNVSEGIWSFASIFSSMIWSHEFGHMLRARQVGGSFHIKRYSFPVIHGRMELPYDHSLEDNALTIVGGFEANYLTVKDIQMDLYRYDKLYNDELSLSFAHRIMFPIYFTLIAPVDPELPETWVNTMGDPVHWIKPVWKRSGREVFQPDGTVNPDLVRFYKRSALMSLFWNFADLNFYREVGASFSGSLGSRSASYIIGDNTNGWGYGTYFNTSIVGAEMNLTNYFRYKKRLYTLSGRYGFPFQNYGIGVGAYQIMNTKKYNVDLNLEMWSQEYYGNGFAMTTNVNYNFYKHFDLLVQAGYKTEGYLIGRILGRGFIGNVGLRYVLER